MFKNKMVILSSLVLLISISIKSDSQTRKIDTNNYAPLRCESNAVVIEAQAEDIIKILKNKNAFVILISNLGKKEKRKFGKRRLFNLKERLSILGVPKEQIITAEGDKTNGYGRIVTYLNGKKLSFINIHKNNDLCVDCCGPDERFFPDKPKSKK